MILCVHKKAKSSDGHWEVANWVATEGSNGFLLQICPNETSVILSSLYVLKSVIQ